MSCVYCAPTDLGMGEDDGDPVPLLNVNGAIVRKIGGCRLTIILVSKQAKYSALSLLFLYPWFHSVMA